MNWYKKLYLGDNIKKKEKKIIRRVERGKPVGDIYLITLASNPENLLDIFRANMLLQKPLARMCPLIVGIAEGYGEAWSWSGAWWRNLEVPPGYGCAKLSGGPAKRRSRRTDGGLRCCYYIFC